jgi:DmsE family decaheme c-type cytochrome
MKRSTDEFSAHVAILPLLLAWIGAVGLSAAARPTRADGPPPAAQSQAAAAGGYAGADACAVCHEDESRAIHATLHGQAVNPRTPAAARGCETCHGPGQAHIDAGGDPDLIVRFDTLAARDVSDTCMSCHDRGDHVQWNSSMHAARNLSCTTCHSVHNPKSEEAQLKKATVIDTCVTCHKTEVMKTQRSGHMPVREGKMTCTTCHNPHGSTNVRMLRVGGWITETCVSCHTEKRGPFLWEHAAGREACNTCHDPHGSNNDHMLVAKLPMLCQRCHIGSRHPSTIYDGLQLAAGSNRLIGRGCVNCHSQIHGTNSPAGNTFLR